MEKTDGNAPNIDESFPKLEENMKHIKTSVNRVEFLNLELEDWEMCYTFTKQV